MDSVINLMTKTFGDFLQEEIDKRHQSLREFADMVGVTHQTISKFLDYGKKDVGYPSMDFLAKVSKATNTDIRTIVSLVLPEAVITQSVDAVVLAEKISRLPKEKQEIIDALINGKVF